MDTWVGVELSYARTRRRGGELLVLISAGRGSAASSGPS